MDDINTVSQFVIKDYRTIQGTINIIFEIDNNYFYIEDDFEKIKDVDKMPVYIKKDWYKYNKKEFYWEHNGMLGVFDYAERVKKKRKWYQENGYHDSLIETPIEGMNLTQSIKYIFENTLNINV